MFSWFRRKSTKRYRPVVLLILDGFGVSLESGNPYDDAVHPTFTEIERWYPCTTIQASGVAVGIPWGESGNSEIGHLTIGAGRTVYPALTRIMMAVRDGSFYKNPALLAACAHAKKNNSTLHLTGLFSSGSVHAFASNLYALLELTKREEVQSVALHLFTDGRDAPIKEAGELYKKLQAELENKYPQAAIASVIGRSYAMERTGRWNKIRAAYDTLVSGKGNFFNDASLYIKTSYAQGMGDESLEPGVLSRKSGTPALRIDSNDAIIWFNHRADSMRELVSSFIADDFREFQRVKLENVLHTTLTDYADFLPAQIAFRGETVAETLGETVARARLKQLRVAEREKYAHITYFLNGGREEPFPREDRLIVTSLEESALENFPEMSAEEIGEAVVSRVKHYDFVAVNLANPDMVGHTGNYRATVKALEVVDTAVGKMMEAVFGAGGVLLITADHGNAEKKIYGETGEPRTKHSSNPVPLYLVGSDFRRGLERTYEEVRQAKSAVRGVLEDVAPTVLELLGVAKPSAMSGTSLFTTLTRLR